MASTEVVLFVKYSRTVYSSDDQPTSERVSDDPRQEDFAPWSFRSLVITDEQKARPRGEGQLLSVTLKITSYRPLQPPCT